MLSFPLYIHQRTHGAWPFSSEGLQLQVFSTAKSLHKYSDCDVSAIAPSYYQTHRHRLAMMRGYYPGINGSNLLISVINILCLLFCSWFMGLTVYQLNRFFSKNQFSLNPCIQFH